MWWVGAILVWLLSFVCIVFVMAEVLRGKQSGLSRSSLGGYALHGVTAVLALWMLLKALGV